MMSALNVKSDARRMGRENINCFAHLLGSKIFAWGGSPCPLNQQSSKTDIGSTFHMAGNSRELRICARPVEAESIFPLFLSNASN